MKLKASPLDNSRIGAEVQGINPKALDNECKEQLHELFLEYGVLVIRNADIDPQEHIDLTKALGNTELHPVKNLRLDDFPEIILLDSGGDVDKSIGKMPDDIVGKIPWHSDLTYTPTLSRGAVLIAKTIPPEGGETGFVDTVAVYNGLSDEMKTRIEGLEAVHQFDYSEDVREARIREAADPSIKPMPKFPDIVHPLVINHPENGYKALNISPMFTCDILGLQPDEAQQLLEELKSIATSSQYSYIHRWREGDIVMWDNWRTLHTALGHKRKYLRQVYRTTLEATVAFGRVLQSDRSEIA